MNIVDLRELSFQYKFGDRRALQELDLTVSAGQSTAILGPTDAGKSTLCLILNGIVPHLVSGKLTGTVHIAGQDSLKLDAETVAQLTRHVGSVFQNPESQLFGLSVEEDIAFGPENLCVPQQEIEPLIDQVLGQVGLHHFRRRSPYLLSGGQKQRVAIASALAMRPELLVLDEPISELDPIGKDEVMEIVRRLGTESQAAIVISDHDPERIAGLVSQVLILAGGQVLARGTPHEVFQNVPQLKQVGLKVPAAIELTWQFTQAGLLDGVRVQEEHAISALGTLIEQDKLRITAPASLPEQSGAGGRPIAIQVRDLSFAYPQSPTTLHHIHLDIYENDYVAMVGANGSGKTTLTKHFNGILKASQGQVLLYGQDLANLRISDAARRVGYVYQNPDHQIFARTVFDEVAFGPRNLGMPETELKQVVEQALAFVGLIGQEKSEPFFLGLGQRQRLAVASVLAMRPDILVVDEPDTGQDQRGAEEMMTLIDRLHASGKTVIIISHNMELVARHARRVISMSGGRLLTDAPIRSFFSSPDTLRAASVKAPQITRIGAALGSPIPFLTIEEATGWLTATAGPTE